MSLHGFYPTFHDIASVRRFLPMGIRLVQLRLKDRTHDVLRTQLTEARDRCAEAGTVLVVNDTWELAIELGCDWVHLGQEDLDRADVSAIRRTGLKLGVSTHHHHELDCALALQPHYVALGSI